MHLVFQIVSFANQNILFEYVKRLEKVERYLKLNRQSRLLMSNSNNNYN
jgi:hypothetical protein